MTERRPRPWHGEHSRARDAAATDSKLNCLFCNAKLLTRIQPLGHML